jgi:hypothetical protein
MYIHHVAKGLSIVRNLNVGLLIGMASSAVTFLLNFVKIGLLIKNFKAFKSSVNIVI